MRAQIFSRIIGAAFVIFSSPSFLAATPAAAPAVSKPAASNTSAVAIIENMAPDLAKQSDDQTTASEDQIKGACRADAKTKLSQCRTPQCEQAVWKEFRICTQQTQEMVAVGKQDELIKEAKEISDQAQSQEHCLAIMNVSNRCDTKANPTCEGRIFEVWQNCSDKFSDKKSLPKVTVSKRVQEIFAKSDERLKAEDKEAEENLKSKMIEEEHKRILKEAEQQEATKRKLEEEKKKIADRQKEAEKSLKDQKINIVAPVTGSGAPINTQTPFSTGALNECQVSFEKEVSACQKEYDKNSEPRLDPAYVQCTQASFGKMRTCYAAKNLGLVQIPSKQEILTFFGQNITTPEQCDEVILKHLERCGNHWNCRKEVQRDAWKCKGVVSLITGH